MLRGLTSVTQSNAPVVYVDGVRMDGTEKPLFDGWAGSPRAG